ncbi:hypothetical protein IGI37_003829 [Enterococcus sp. AZ194]|uniref:hypothetical protein n=1 Tax=Enterococcus sp. AZ194 TaxID=2774629 RepID=UPI003F25272C
MFGWENGKLKPFIDGYSVYETAADELFERLKEKNNGEILDDELGYSYSFLEISIGIYRRTLPSDIDQMIDELNAEGLPTENVEWLEQDKLRANYWETIGMGVKNYFS